MLAVHQLTTNDHIELFATQKSQLNNFRDFQNLLRIIPKLLQELGFFARQSPGVERSKTSLYSNIGLFLIFQPRGFRAAKKPINEVVWV